MMWMLVAVAVAQSANDTPAFSAQNFQSAIDNRTAWWTESTATYRELVGTAQIIGQYAQNPLVQRYTDDTEVVLLGNLFQADVTAAVHVSRFRVGLAAPIVLSADGAATGARLSGLGDLAFDAKVNLVTDGDGPFGLAVSGRATLPTTRVDAPVGTSATGWQLLALADKRAGLLLFGVNVGVRGQPVVALNNVTLGDQLVYRTSVGVVLGETSGLSFELAGAANLQDRGAAGQPMEGMVGGWTPIAAGFRLRGGLGTGLTEGIGAPDVRVLAAISWDPNLNRDRDADGIPDRVDACPLEAEDPDGRADEDGCSDPETHLFVAVETPEGHPVPNATTTLVLPDGTETGTSELELIVPPGRYPFSASAPGFATIGGELTVPLASELRLERVMTPVAVPVKISLTDLGGLPLDGEWALDEGVFQPVNGGEVTTELLAGTYTIHARAPGFVAGEQTARVKPDGDNVVHVRLGKRVGLGWERIELNEVVQFGTNSATLLPASFPMLNEVALIINTHPELTKVKIEGHTDARGDDRANLELSTRRAAAILFYLTTKGVPVERLASEGFGESHPIASNDTEAGRAQNRRVEIKIESRAEPAE